MSDDVGTVATGPITYNDGRLSAVATALRAAGASIAQNAKWHQGHDREDVADALRSVADALSQAATDIEAAGVLPFPPQGGG